MDVHAVVSAAFIGAWQIRGRMERPGVELQGRAANRFYWHSPTILFPLTTSHSHHFVESQTSPALSLQLTLAQPLHWQSSLPP